MMTDKRMRRAANILLFIAALLLAIALATLLSGGFAVPAIAFSSRDPLRPFLAALALAAIARACTNAADYRELVERYTGTPRQWPARVAVLAAACVLVFALAWTSRAAGGSDSSCYVLQAEAFAHGRATLANPVAAVLPGMPNAVFAPTGFVASRDYGAAVPICAPGLALAMAGPFLVHPALVFLIVPLSAALLVWLTFVYGCRVHDEVTGACGAVLVACSPIVLYQAVQPMSDVPAATAWMGALVATSPVVAGVWASAAILIRPNLALLVLALLLFRRDWRVVLAMIPGLAVLLALNAAR